LLKVDGLVEIPYIADEVADKDPDMRISVKDKGPIGKRLKEAAAAHELHGEVDLGLAGHHLVEVNDVWVLHHLHHQDLPLDLIHHPQSAHGGGATPCPKMWWPATPCGQDGVGQPPLFF
jgi:hypothetical protein